MALKLISKPSEVLCISFSSNNVVVLERCIIHNDLPSEEADAYRSLIKHSGFYH